VARPFQSPQPIAQRPSDLVPLQLVLVPSGRTLELKQPDQMLGRHSSSDIRLPLADVSRRHCRIFFTNASWHVLDMDSTNGVFVNHRKVHQSRLASGDLLRIGSFLFEVRVGQTAGTVVEPRRAS
jgi:pSer/pThr/pTyr-binding forkhead associated (FHA) protein